MIQQAHRGLDSRSEAIPFDENGFLPLITAPMYSVVDETNYKVFLDNKIQVCLPREVGFDDELSFMEHEKVFVSCSLKDFIKIYITDFGILENVFIQKQCVCIDTANGNIPALHDAIRKAKELHGENLIIMAGNVSSENAFIELAKTGVDYIRVGIGGGGGCNTTSNTGVGQGEYLSALIWEINNTRARYKTAFLTDNGYRRIEGWQNIANVKIVADGISSYVKYCQKERGFNDNGYAAINTLLYNGADLVMIGSLFAQCVESAGEKGVKGFFEIESFEDWNLKRTNSGAFGLKIFNNFLELFNSGIDKNSLYVKLQGMSTKEAQNKYKKVIGGFDILDFGTTPVKSIEHYDIKEIKPSEGKTVWLPVRWTLNNWLYGNETDELPGFINMLKSAMAYRGAKKLENFKEE